MKRATLAALILSCLAIGAVVPETPVEQIALTEALNVCACPGRPAFVGRFPDGALPDSLFAKLEPKPRLRKLSTKTSNRELVIQLSEPQSVGRDERLITYAVLTGELGSRVVTLHLRRTKTGWQIESSKLLAIS